MRVFDLINLGSWYLKMGIMAALFVMFCILTGYFVVYRKLLKGQRKIKKTTIFSYVLAGIIVAGTATAFATSANAQPQQAEAAEQDGKIEIVFKPDSIPQIADNAGVFYKEDSISVDIDTMNVQYHDDMYVQTAITVQPDDIRGVPVEKTGAEEDELSENNVIYFSTEAEREEHLRALEANIEKGLDRYAGFEEMYEGIDTSGPIAYVVK